MLAAAGVALAATNAPARAAAGGGTAMSQAV
jgi:hypothetical protein